MAELRSKKLDEPDEIIALPRLSGQIVVLGESQVARVVHQAGWHWAEHVKPTMGTTSCQFHHQGVILSGRLHIQTDDGAERTLGPGEAFDIPPGHDGWVVGDEDCVTIEFRGVRAWGRPAEAAERVLTTMLLTDVVDSTATAALMGDAPWQRLLARHLDAVRQQVDRFRGYEVKTIGDGLLATFDGAARAARCATAIGEAASIDGIQVRVGIHTGEVERLASDLQGLAVHALARITTLAGAREVVISDATAPLLEGSGLTLEDAGTHALKGLAGERRVFRLVR